MFHYTETYEEDYWIVSKSQFKLLSLQFPYIKYNDLSPCDICHSAKQRKLSFKLSESHSNKIFYLLHADIWGPYVIPSLYGHKYFFILVDDFSGHTWVILMKSKVKLGIILSDSFAILKLNFKQNLRFQEVTMVLSLL